MSARKLLKVYRANLDGRYEGVVAATSFSAAARLMGLRPSHMRNYGGVTGCVKSIELAMREPGVAWKKSFSAGGQWERIELRNSVTGT